MKQGAKLLLFILFICFALYVIFSNAGASSQENRTFDHSQCQYPDRTTNHPANGCDNSDPCDPASAAKGGSGDCTPVSTLEAEIQTSYNIEIVGK